MNTQDLKNKNLPANKEEDFSLAPATGLVVGGLLGSIIHPYAAIPGALVGVFSGAAISSAVSNNPVSVQNNANCGINISAAESNECDGTRKRRGFGYSN